MIEVKRKIISLASEICLRYGFKSPTMDAIATELGISKKTLYQFFKDKNELVDNVMEYEIDRRQFIVTNIAAKSKNAVDEVFLTLRQLRIDFQGMNPIVLYDLQKYYGDTYRKFLRHKNDFIYTIITNNLKKGIAEGYYRPDINVDIMSKFRLESMMLSFDQTIFPSSIYSLIEVNNEILEHFLYGIATQKGIKEYQFLKNSLLQNNSLS